MWICFDKFEAEETLRWLCCLHSADVGTAETVD